MIDDHDASHDRLRLAVARALDSYAELELFECLADPDPILRTTAARRLHVRGTRSTFDHAVELLRRARFELREIGAFLLGQLGTPDCPYADKTFPLLVGLLQDDYAEVRSAAILAIGSLATLGQRPPEYVADRLLEMTRRSATLQYLDLAQPNDTSVRASLAFAIGAIGGTAAKTALDTLLDDPDPGVREMAELGCELLGGGGDHDRESTRAETRAVDAA